MANYRISMNTNNSKKKRTTTTTAQRKMDHLKLFKLKRDVLIISIDLQTAIAADTHLAEGQWLKEQLNVVQLRMFRVGTRMQTVSRADGQ
jgi:hypothetical protein